MKLRGAVCDTMMELTNLVLDEELDTLDGGSGSLGDGSGDTTHCCPMLAIVSHVFQALIGAGTRVPSMRHRGAALDIKGERTHEVNDEAGHAHELLLALAVMDVSMFSRWRLSPEAGQAGKGDGCGALLTRHPWSRFQWGQTFCRLCEGVYDGVERVLDEAGW
jgi:hypothetical protein